MSADLSHLAHLAVPRRDERLPIPGAVVEEVYAPESQAQVTEIVSAAAQEKAGLLVSGGGTRLWLANCASPSRPIRVGLSLGGFTGIDEFVPDEGVLHAAAGTPIEEIRQLVREEGWELPLDSPGPATTVGGTISSAVTGPRALSFGSVSDAILGLDVVGGDGVASKCGGRVVKNVTGYDLAKLYCGSYGSLAVVTGAWLRLRPVAAVRETLHARLPADGDTFEAIRALARLTSVRALVWSQPAESELESESGQVFIELGGSREGVAHDRSSLANAFAFEGASDDSIDEVREARAETVSGPGEVALRVRVLPSECDAMRRSLLGQGLSVSIDPGLGAIHARGQIEGLSALLAIRGQAEQAGGFATFEQLPDAWRPEVDVFGSLGGTESLVESLKARFDPSGVLNPGRFVAEAPLGVSSPGRVVAEAGGE